MKCIALDMDGTLLGHSHEVEVEEADAIRFARKQGTEVVICTGRSRKEALLPIEKAGLSLPMICVNGAQTWSEDGELLSAVHLETDQFRSVESILTELDIYFEVYATSGNYTTDADKAVSVFIDLLSSFQGKDSDYEQIKKAAQKRINEGSVHIVDDYQDVIGNEGEGFLKVLAFSFDDHKLQKARELLDDIEELAVSSSGKGNLEITNVKAQKGFALAEFVQNKGITLEDTMAVGDNYNDVSMFTLAGKAVAMGNADDTVKSKADEVTLTNDEHGVAHAILNALNVSEKA
ncbi:Cof-type HAD-IIB family hydrolase [Aureibacillus halotolerans]|uniref:Cof subfamily protein (Haloacid dehalogenase superfamily)/HAD superfamily hydrolase (TIGR01484 family) n=1 Tax=Aureibacillus halotolerans TaxID=1508390 RepID=A0A4R6U6Q8_9BACI|nr:Cof-type HAD-IIB family hydrolase [Aureibacillus halotolerans]TDQ42188.1 hypothetical protein EV213_102219 [Aureibacillus halotolerans]